MSKPRRILLVRTDRIGELLLTTPAFDAVRESFPGAEITLAVRPSSSAVVEGNPSIDSVIRLDPHHDLGSFAKKYGFIRSLAKSAFDMAVIFNPSKFLNIAAFLAGIPVRAGYDRKWGFLLTHSIEDRKYLCEKHEVEYNLDLAKAVGASVTVKKLTFPLTGGDEHKAEIILAESGIPSGATFIAVHPGTSNSEKSWPAERFAEMCDRVVEGCCAEIILVGGAEERGTAKEVADKTRRRIIDLTGKLSLKEFGALLKKASLLISCDSGPVHVACAVGTPVIALFGEARPGGSSTRWGPYSEGNVIVGRPKVTDIKVEDVFEAVNEKLCKRR